MLYGIGTDVSSATTMEEALKIAGLDWNVEPKDVVVDEKVIEGIQANVTDQGKFLGIVSNKYKIVNNMEAFSFADNLMNQVKLDTAGSLFDDKKIWVATKFNDIDLAGQKIENYLVFTNSHDGKSSIRAAIIPIAKNGYPLNLPLDKKRNWSISHSGNIDKKMDQAKETLIFAEDYLSELVKQTEKMIETKITEKQLDAFIEQLFPIKPQDGDRRIDNVVETRMSVKNSISKIQEYIGTAWQVINGVSAYISNSQAKRSSETFDQNKFNNFIVGHGLLDDAYRILKINYVK